VTFKVGQALSRLTPNDTHIASATTVDSNGLPQPVVADWYVAAIPCEKLAAVLTPDMIAADSALANIALLHAEWMNGLMFYLKERVDVTKGHANYVDSRWGITSISEEQFWKRSLTTYGDGTVKDCLSACCRHRATRARWSRSSSCSRRHGGGRSKRRTKPAIARGYPMFSTFWTRAGLVVNSGV
jgi:hypothetical protein